MRASKSRIAVAAGLVALSLPALAQEVTLDSTGSVSPEVWVPAPGIALKQVAGGERAVLDSGASVSPEVWIGAPAIALRGAPGLDPAVHQEYVRPADLVGAHLALRAVPAKGPEAKAAAGGISTASASGGAKAR